jgi:hypothetical protein
MDARGDRGGRGEGGGRGNGGMAGQASVARVAGRSNTIPDTATLPNKKAPDYFAFCFSQNFFGEILSASAFLLDY